MTRLKAIYVKSAFLLLCAIVSSFQVDAQFTLSEHEYKFVVSDVKDMAVAKQVLLALDNSPLVTSQIYTPGCDCFKVATTVPVNYTLLNFLIAQSGHHIVGKILAANGDVLLPPETESELEFE